MLPLTLTDGRFWAVLESATPEHSWRSGVGGVTHTHTHTHKHCSFFGLALPGQTQPRVRRLSADWRRPPRGLRPRPRVLPDPHLWPCCYLLRVTVWEGSDATARSGQPSSLELTWCGTSGR